MTSERTGAVLLVFLVLCSAATTRGQDASSRRPGAPQAQPAAAHPDPALEKVRALLREAKEQQRAGNHGAARETIREAWKAVKALAAADTRQEVQDLTFDIGRAAYEAGDLRAALVMWETLTGLWQRRLPDDHRDLQAARQYLAGTKTGLGDRRGALALEEKVFEVFSRTLPDDHADLQAARANLALTRRGLGDLEGALALQEKVLEVRSRTLPDDHPELQVARLNLGATKHVLGDLQGALLLASQVFEVLSRTLPDDHPHLQAARQSLAMTKFGLGDLRGALPLFESVLEVRSRTLPEDHIELQAARLNLAATRHALGDLQGALVLAEGVFDVLSRTLPDDHSHLQAARENLAAAKHALGDSQGALALFEKVREIRSRTIHDDDVDLQRTRLNLAMVKEALGDRSGALALAEKVLEVRSRILPDDHPDLQMTRNNLAVTKMDLGDRKGALALQEKVLEISSRTLPDYHLDLQVARSNLASTLITEDPGRSRRLLHRALEGADRRLGFVGATMSPRAYEAASREVSNLMSTVLSLKDPDAEPSATSAEELSLLLRFRGLVDRERRRRDALERAARLDEQLRKLISAARQTDLEFQRVLSSPDPGLRGKLPALRQAVESSQEAVIRAAAKLAKEPARLPDRSDLATLARHLPERAAAIVTASYARQLPWDETRQRQPDPLPSTTAFVLRPDGSVRRVELGESARIARLSGNCVRSCSASVRARGRSIPESTPAKDPTAELAEILAPLLSALPGNTRTLYLAPDGALASIPWEILPVQGRPLRERVSIRYVDTLTALLPTARVEGEASLLVFGGIDYGGEPVAVAAPPSAPDLFTARCGETFASLPGSRREAEAIHGLFAEILPKQTARLLTGREASKASFLALAENFRILHLATHAFVADEKTWELGQAENRPGSPHDVGAGSQTGAVQSASAGYARALLSGIVFAGANRELQGSTDDAVLTAAELSLLDLSRCELAVLSACQTNVGPRYAAEAVTGLNRALQLAGVRHTITSLWKIDDDGAAAFFRVFYEQLWKEKLSVPAAFEAARDAVIRAGFGPGVWAGFVLYVTGQERTWM